MVEGKGGVRKYTCQLKLKTTMLSGDMIDRWIKNNSFKVLFGVENAF